MFQKFNFSILILCVLSTSLKCLPMEPVCSKFDYEYKTLEAMLRVERYVEDMKKEMEKIQDDITKKLQEIEEFKQNQERDFNALKNAIEEKAVVKSEPVENVKVPRIAFSVGNPTNTHNNGVPLFTTITTNVGQAYNTQTGEFTCPIDGVYIFVLTIASNFANQDNHCRINLNNKEVSISRSYKTHYSTVSNTVILALTKNDVVAPGNCVGIKQFYTSHSATSFSGALIAKN